MSKNFELMQRAGRLLEIELPSTSVSANTPEVTPVSPKYAPALAPVVTPPFAPARLGKWRAHRHRALDGGEYVREESRRLVQEVFLGAQDPPRVVVFAAMNHGNGCSCICANAAEALSEHIRGSICLIDANLRSPSLHEIYRTKNHHGFTDALMGQGPMRDFAKPIRKDNFFLMSCGSTSARQSGLFHPDRIRNRFRDLRSEFDFVLIDAPPVTRYTDAVALGKIADGFVLVLEANSTRREAALRVSAQLRAAQIRLLGAVLNKRTFPIPETIYRHL
jgi:capsular exopolysaccharide synthesis family protein